MLVIVSKTLDPLWKSNYMIHFTKHTRVTTSVVWPVAVSDCLRWRSSVLSDSSWSNASLDAAALPSLSTAGRDCNKR